MMKFENCTMFIQGFMGFNTVHCKWVEVKVGPYAQYSAAVHVTYLEKGKRKARGFVQAYKPSLVIAAGHVDAKQEVMRKSGEGDGFQVFQSIHSSCSEEWVNDFNRDILPKLEVLANYQGHNSHDKYSQAV